MKTTLRNPAVIALAGTFLLLGGLSTTPVQAALIYAQNFNSLAAASDVEQASPTTVNAQLAGINWVMYSDGRGGWAYHEGTRTSIVNTGGGNMAIREAWNSGGMQGTGFSTEYSLALYKPTVFPSFQDVSISGYVAWGSSPVTYSSASQQGLIFRADANAKTTGQSSFGGSFYFVRVSDLNGPDTLNLTRVISGAETTLAGTVVWKNGHTNYDGITSGYLKIDVQNTGDNSSVLVDALFSGDPTFANPASEIVAAHWADSASARLTAGGSVGFAGIETINRYYYQPNWTWDNLAVAELVPEPATMAFLTLGGLSMIGAGLRRRRVR
ncbi:MAG: PEP-CTERM sorting domain-containing protein [Phycisphaerae bacterium]|nr:PEP-CTERM sorting domain-containing protein [Phycisphaerae bacterium]